MQKAKRLLAIENIITEVNISTQEELLKILKGKGISCTQATLSRNLRQLGVSRIPDGIRQLQIFIVGKHHKFTGFCCEIEYRTCNSGYS